MPADIIDGEPVVLRNALTYKGVLLANVPNLAMVFGPTNGSWTLKADPACEYVCRLLMYMDKHGYTQVIRHADDSVRREGSVLGDLDSGCERRGNDKMPRRGSSGPWRVRNDYLRDAPMLRHRSIADDALESGAHAGPEANLSRTQRGADQWSVRDIRCGVAKPFRTQTTQARLARGARSR